MFSDFDSIRFCSRLLCSYELTAYLRNAWSLVLSADDRADFRRSERNAFASEEPERWREEAARHREFLWTVRPDDRVWLTVDEPRHPECGFGTPYLVVVRAGKVILRYRVSDWALGDVIVPRLPNTLRLTHDQIILLACALVRKRYPIVPPVALVLEFSEETIVQLEQKYGYRLAFEERARCLNKWWVSFAVSQDSDELQMAANIQVIVDDLTGEVKIEGDTAERSDSP